MTNMFRALAVLAAVFTAACAAISQQKAQVPRADNLEFHNLKVLPPNITHDELIATMRGFARSLGTRCNHCHVSNPPGAISRAMQATSAEGQETRILGDMRFPA